MGNYLGQVRCFVADALVPMYEGEPCAWCGNDHRPGMLSLWGDLHHGKYDSPLCHYVAEAHDGSIIGDVQDYVSSDVDVDYWAKLGKRRIYHVDDHGFHYLWKYDTETERDEDFYRSTVSLRSPEGFSSYVIGTDPWCARIVCDKCAWSRVTHTPDMVYVTEEAEVHMMTEHDDEEETEEENPYSGPGGLIEELRQSERMLGEW